MTAKFSHAIVRKPGENFAHGITTSNLGPANYDLLLKQHEAYIERLKSLGLEVILLEALPKYPDAYFVEDTAVVTPDVAVITNPGATSRQGEEITIDPVLAKYRKTVRIKPPGTVDGGDVIEAGTHFIIGLSERTNKEGAEQLGGILEKYGNTWTTVSVEAGLHLKSSVNYVGKNTLLLTENFADCDPFNSYAKIVLDQVEQYAGNTLLINDCLLTPKGFTNTKIKLQTLHRPIMELDMSEIQKMDGGLTCLSLRF